MSRARPVLRSQTELALRILRETIGHQVHPTTQLGKVQIQALMVLEQGLADGVLDDEKTTTTQQGYPLEGFEQGAE